jgi:DNA-binding beta-propeller fold protein YncE
MTPSHVSARVAGKIYTACLARSCYRLRFERARGGASAFAACALTVALGATTAQASLLSPVSTFGSQGSGSGELQTPTGVAIQQANGAVYVADSGNARVEKFDVNGTFLAAWGWGVAGGAAHSEVCTATCQAGIPGSGPGQFSLPTSIAVGAPPGSSAAKVYVGDAGNNVILKFDADGNFLATIDGSTTPQGHFVSLAGVAVDQSGNLWTADGSTSNVDEFDAHGNFVRQWSDPAGQPEAIAVDSVDGALYLISSGNTQRFSLTGTPGAVVDSRPGALTGTGVALALDPQTGNLYVDHRADVAVYDRTGSQLDSLSLSPTTNSQGLAFRSRMGRLYVTDASNDNVTIYAPVTTAGPPLIAVETAKQTSRSTATLHTSVVPLGHDTSCEFQYVDDADFQSSGYSKATTVPCSPADLGSSFSYQTANATATGLTGTVEPGATYHFRVIASNSAGTITGADQTFQQNFDWAPFARCPVDDPTMLATDGVNTASFCAASNSTHGSITIGNLTTATGNTNLQFGFTATPSAVPVSSIVSPTGGALVEDPVQISSPIGPVTAVTESAGTPSNFNPMNLFVNGQVLITIPIKIHLENPTLGPSCFIGSDQNPIVLNPVNLPSSIGNLLTLEFDPNGLPDPNGPMFLAGVVQLVQGDDTFSVPGATGCGTNDSLDAAVNAVVGLPSPSGHNHLELDDAASYLGFDSVNPSGQQLSKDWHIGFE